MVISFRNSRESEPPQCGRFRNSEWLVAFGQTEVTDGCMNEDREASEPMPDLSWDELSLEQMLNQREAEMDQDPNMVLSMEEFLAPFADRRARLGA